MTLHLPSGENLAPPARIRRLKTGQSGEEVGGGVMKEERRNAGWDGEDGGMSRQTALQVVVVVVVILTVIIIVIIIDLLSLWRTEAPVGLGAGVNGHKKVK